MKAIDVLMQEHRVIERVLNALESAAYQIEHGQPIRPQFFLEAADFVTGFADGCHHRKEEGVLFSTMIENGAMGCGGAIDMMLQEHAQARTYTRALRDAATRLERGEADAGPKVVASAKRYVALLRDHIAKEDEMLFPMAAELIPSDRDEEVLARFARVEHEDTGPNAHGRFVALAERLEREGMALARQPHQTV